MGQRRQDAVAVVKEKIRCCEMVWRPGLMRPAQCKKPSITTPPAKPYCKAHDPVLKKQKLDAEKSAYDQQVIENERNQKEGLALLEQAGVEGRVDHWYRDGVGIFRRNVVISFADFEALTQKLERK